MSKDQVEGSSPLPGARAPKGKKGLIIGILVALLAAAGGGGAAYWKFGMAAASAAEESHAPAAATKSKASAHGPEDPGLLAFEPFLVNLADDGGQSYLRVTLSLLVASEAAAKALEAQPVTLTRLRSAILEALSTQTAAQVATAEGKTELKRVITERVAALDPEIEVHDVLFSDFVVQY
ncbi:MAG: flagellar basal body-associated FliL family protein [Vicinamibacterales bacterium]|nr:flagellar basal body-associated FliL family protein [Vicinamibacterales bacterium]